MRHNAVKEARAVPGGVQGGFSRRKHKIHWTVHRISYILEIVLSVRVQERVSQPNSSTEQKLLSQQAFHFHYFTGEE